MRVGSLVKCMNPDMDCSMEVGIVMEEELDEYSGEQGWWVLYWRSDSEWKWMRLEDIKVISL